MIKCAAYRGTGWVSFGIKTLTYSPYSHIGALFTEDMTVQSRNGVHQIAAGNVIEAWKGGVKLSASLSARHAPGTPVDIFGFNPELARDEQAAMAAFLVSQIGKKYAYWNVAHFVPIVRWCFPNPSPIYDRNHVFCSELFIEGTNRANRPMFNPGKQMNGKPISPPWEIPPRDCPRSIIMRYEKTVFCGQ